ncbi:MAG: hypothetical protein Q8P51_13015 [Ignavibacteria bacterium]|nr:hypothetical protein [Ignavibacteria bacterium]
MDNKPDKSNRTLILYFALSVIFALLSILASKVMTVTYFPSFAKITINLKWMFWLSTTLSVAFILPLIRSLLFVLHQQGRLPKVFGWFFRDEVVLRFVSIIRSLQNLIFSTLGRLVLAGLGILVLTAGVRRSGAIHETEIDSNLFTIVDAARGRYSDIKEEVFSTVELCTYHRSEESDYLRDCLKLVNDLKAAGVKVVMLGMSQSFGRKVDLTLLKELENTGIVVFATDYGRTIRIADSTGELTLSAGSVTISNREVEETNRLVRLRPTGIENVGSPRLLDVSIEILRKYKGYGSDVAWDEDRGEFRFGDHRIPVTSGGWMYSQDRESRIPLRLVYVDSTGTWSYESGLARSFSLGITTGAWSYEWRGARFLSPRITTAGLKIEGNKIPMQDIGTRLQGKIVLLMESFGPTGSYLVSKSYQSAIENILSGTIIRKWEQGHLWVSVLCLVLAGLIAFRVRLVVAFLILLALLPCVLMFGWYLYTSHSILIDMFYPLLATAMAIVVFPIIAMGHPSGSRKDGFADAG